MSGLLQNIEGIWAFAKHLGCLGLCKTLRVSRPLQNMEGFWAFAKHIGCLGFCKTWRDSGPLQNTEGVWAFAKHGGILGLCKTLRVYGLNINWSYMACSPDQDRVLFDSRIKFRVQIIDVVEI